MSHITWNNVWWCFWKEPVNAGQFDMDRCVLVTHASFFSLLWKLKKAATINFFFLRCLCSKIGVEVFEFAVC